MKNSIKNMVLETMEGLYKTGTVDEINTTQIYLEKEITYSILNIKVLKNWCTPLLKSSNPFKEDSYNLLVVLGESVSSSLISSLYNIFTNSDEVSLWRLINQVNEISKISKKEDYIERIKEIREGLNPLRNIARAHNIPWRKDQNIKIPLSKLEEWLSFAENTYKEMVKKLGMSYPLNGLVPEEFDKQIIRNINLIYKDKHECKG